MPVFSHLKPSAKKNLKKSKTPNPTNSHPLAQTTPRHMQASIQLKTAPQVTTPITTTHKRSHTHSKQHNCQINPMH
jgi:hypothetical protein